MKGSCLTLLLFQFLFTAFPITAQQDIQFSQVSTANGLAGDIVYSLLQDRNGFLWIGTHRGLNRYDGYHFRHYQNNPTDTNSFSSNHILNIKEDSDGMIWITTPIGLNRFDPGTGKVNRFVPMDTAFSKDMRDIILVNDSIILITTSAGILLFNKKQHQFKRIEISEELTGYYFNWSSFRKGRNGDIYLDNKSGSLILIDWQNSTGTSYSSKKFVPGIPRAIPEYRISAFYADKSGNSWYCYTDENGKLTIRLSGTPDSITVKLTHIGIAREIFIYEDATNHIWFCTDAGLVHYDYSTHVFSLYLHQPNNPHSISNNATRCILRDRAGVYWVGSFGSGLNRFQLMENEFKHINLLSPGNSINSMMGDLRTMFDGKIFGSDINGSAPFIINEKHKVEKMDPKYRTLEARFYEATRIRLNTLAEKERKFAEKVMKEGNDYNNLLVDHSGQIWVRWRNGFYNSESSVNTFSQIGPVLLTGHTTFLVGTDDGLKIFNYKNLAIEDLLPEQSGTLTLQGIMIHDLLPDPNGNYWIATANNGLVFLNASRKQFIQFTKKDGLPDNTLYKILKDTKGRLWISSNNGLSCFDTASKTFINYTIADGLLNTEYNRGSACVDSNGYMYFGGMNGLDYFHPDSIRTGKPPPPVLLSAFTLFGQQKQLLPGYSLATSENSFTIEFTTNDLLNASKIFFRYRLKGAEENQTLLQGTNIAIYNKLPPGNYHFIIEASYNNKNWGPVLEIPIRIAVPWYNSWWFYGLSLLILAAIIYFLFRFRLQQKLRVLQIRNRLHQDLHDDVGATLSSIKVYSEILSDNPDNPVISELIKENSTEMLERLEVISWATNPQHDHFKSLKSLMIKFATPLCHAKNIQCRIENKAINEDMMMPGEIRQNIFLVFKEAINNMIKYAAATECNTNMFINNNQFVLQIIDNGKGYDGSTKGTGSGWKNMQNRTEVLNGNIIIESIPGKGTTITMNLPYPFRIPSSWERKKTDH